MKNYKYLKFGFVVAVFSLMLVVFFQGNNTLAAVPSELPQSTINNAVINIRNKVIYEAVKSCYYNLSESIDLSKKKLTWGEIFGGNGDVAGIPIPNYVFGNNATVKDRKDLKCSQLMGGWNSLFGGAFKGIGYRDDDSAGIPVGKDGFIDNTGSTKEMMADFLRTIGYSEDETVSDSDYRCIYYAGTMSTSYGTGEAYETDRVCAKPMEDDNSLIDSNYEIDVQLFYLQETSDLMYNLSGKITYSNNTLKIPRFVVRYWVGSDSATTNQMLISTKLGCDGGHVGDWGVSVGATCDKKNNLVITKDQLSFDDLANALGAALIASSGTSNQEPIVGSPTVVSNALATFKKGSLDAYLKHFLGDNYELFGRPLTDTELYVLYWSGLTSIGVKQSSKDKENGNVRNWLQIATHTFATDWTRQLECDKNCTINTINSNGSLKRMNAINLNNKMDSNTVLGLLNNLDYDSEDFGEVEAPVEDLYPNVVEPTDKESSQACYNGAGPLGWILCPIIEGITGFGTVLWNDVEQNHLKTPAKEIFADGGGVENVWSRIRDIGNIVFVILFLIVIFSQLTGVGIDNYGIKKILPKLVLVAVLTNLSWIMCELAVDLSNIVGSGINSLLTGMAPDVTIVADTGSAPATAAVVDLALASGGIALFAWLNPIGLVSAAFAVLGMVLSILAGIAVMYVVLLIREAGIVLLVCLAPVAIVGYALPNTEKLSKKWLSLFKALLIVYPICGLVMGGGKLAGAVLASVNSESKGMKLAAMIIQVLPFFLIPMILKKSLSLMGNVGARVSQMGRGLSRRASGMIQSGVRNSEKFKNFSNFEQNRRTLRKANRIQKRFDGRDAKSLSKREQHLAAWANKTAASLENQQKRDEMMADREMGYKSEVSYGTAALSNEREKKYSETFANMTNRKDVEEAFEKAVLGNDKEKASAAFKELINQGGIEQAMNILSEDSVWDKMKASGVDTRIIQAMGSSKVDAFKAYNKYRSSGGTAAFKDWYRGTLSEEQLNKEKGHVKNQTYAEHLMRRDKDSMINFDKDEIKYMMDHAPIAGELDGKKFDSGMYYRMVTQLMLNSSDPEARTRASNIIEEGIKSGGENFLADGGFTTGSFEKMRGRDAEMIVKAYTEKHGGNREAALSDIRGQLSTQIANAKNDPGALRNMDKEVLDMLGLKKDGNNTNASSANGENGVLRVGGNTNANGTNVNANANANANANVRARGANANSAARRSGIIEDSNYREYNVRRVEPVAPAPQSYADVLPRVQGKTYEDIKDSDALPTWVQNEKDYQQLMVGAEASKVLTEINGKSFEEVKDSGVLPTSVNDEQGYKNYVRELGTQVQDTSNLKQYRVAQSKTYEQARDGGDAPAWVQDAQDYDRFVAGAEAKAMLPKIKDKTYEQARDSGVLPDGINSDNEFKKYSSELRIKAQDADSIRQYRAIEGKTYEQARDSGALPSGIGRAEYGQFSREYKIQFDEARKRGAANSVKPVNGQGNRPRQDDNPPSGDFIVPRQ